MSCFDKGLLIVLVIAFINYLFNKPRIKVDGEWYDKL